MLRNDSKDNRPTVPSGIEEHNVSVRNFRRISSLRDLRESEWLVNVRLRYRKHTDLMT